MSGLILEARVVTLFFFISFLPGNPSGRPKKVVRVVEQADEQQLLKQQLQALRDEKKTLLIRLFEITDCAFWVVGGRPGVWKVPQNPLLLPS